ncbi:MAG TPA: hypothetical protein P5079_11645, partial [Elusimicrobiota bacterium]|nr:hypothetical protein [Elusimicrobiota bacterium]
PAILLFTVVGIVYISLGGIKAVVWTNLVQALVILGGGIATLVFLGSRITGGGATLWRTAAAGGRLHVLDYGVPFSAPDFWTSFFSNPNILWLAALNGLFGSMAAFGTDHDLMQRLLTVETRRESQRTMALTIPVSLAVLLIYLSIGTGLYVFYAQNPALPLPDNGDKIFPHFIAQVMPPLLRGLLLSAIVLASIDSPLASLSASFVTDLYRPFRRWLGERAGPGGRLGRLHRRLPPEDEAHFLRMSRWGVAGFGAVLAGLAFFFSHFENILWLAFKIGGVTFGSLLGVFLLGLLTDRRGDRANVLAMTLSAGAMFVLLVLSEKHILPLGWSWLVILGTLVTFSAGWLLGPAWEKKR